MGRGLKIYTAIIAAVVVALIAVAVYEPAKVRELNAVLDRDESLSAYPYRFHVLRVEEGVAVMSSPRSASVPVPRIIKVIYPSLEGVAVTDQRYLAAQQQLAEYQGRAAKRVLSDPDIVRVRWELDEIWLRERGVVFK